MLSSERCLKVVIALTVIAAPFAHADTQADAKDLFEHGRQLRSTGDCAAAAPLFHKAYAIFPSALGPLRNAAECEESLGRWASARRSWLDLKRALMTTQESKYAGWATDAESAAQRLEGKVAHLTVDVSGPSPSDERLAITINGEAFPRTLIGTAMDRDPGKYVVRARLATGDAAEETIELATAEMRAVRLVVAVPAGSSPPLQVQTPTVSPNRTASPWTPIGWVTLSVGLGALAGMGIAIGVRQDALGTLSGKCDYVHGPCPTSLESVVARGQAASTAATVLAVAGGVTAGAGLLMLVLVATRHGEQRVAVVPSPMSRDGWGLSLTGTFE